MSVTIILSKLRAIDPESIRVDRAEEHAARTIVAGDLEAVLYRQIDIRARRVVLAVAEPVTRRNPHARAERNAVVDARVVVRADHGIREHGPLRAVAIHAEGAAQFEI